MKFVFKIGSFFFCKVIVVYKNENQRSKRGLKNKKKCFLIKKVIVKIYLGLSLVLLWTVWGQFIFR